MESDLILNYLTGAGEKEKMFSSEGRMNEKKMREFIRVRTLLLISVVLCENKDLSKQYSV